MMRSVLRKIAYDSSARTTHTDYIDDFLYINGTLAYFPSLEGRVLFNGSAYTNEYTISDQQGNARISFNNTGTGGARQVVQENSYYGYGMVMPGTAATGGDNKLLYNGGSEWQNDYSNMPDYYQTPARNYDAAIGRFISQDPMAEGAASMSTYHYAGDNPIMMNDPTGNQAAPVGRTTSLLWAEEVHDPNFRWFSSNSDAEMGQWISSLGASGGGIGAGGFAGGDLGGEDQLDFTPPDNPWSDGTTYAENEAAWSIVLTDLGLSLDFSPKAYGVDENGYLHLLGDAEGNSDVLLAGESDATLNNVEEGALAGLAVVQKRTFNNFGTDHSYDASGVDLTGDDQATALFSFLAKNTSVEWGLVKYGSNCDYIGTSHLGWIETVASQFAFSEAQNNHDVREYDHDHPFPGPSTREVTGPSGLLPGDGYTDKGSGDIASAASIQSYNHQYSFTQRKYVDIPIIFNVYDQRCNQIIQYNSKLILDVKPW